MRKKSLPCTQERKHMYDSHSPSLPLPPISSGEGGERKKSNLHKIEYYANSSINLVFSSISPGKFTSTTKQKPAIIGCCVRCLL